MNKTRRIAFGIGIVLVVLAAFTASAAATNVAYFDPDPSCAAPGETVYVELRLNSTQGVVCMETDIYFDPNVLNITNAEPGDFPVEFGFGHHGNFVAMGGVAPNWLELPPGNYLFANLTFEAKNTGTSALTYDRNHLWDEYFDEIFDVIWNDGTFNCPCGVPKPDLMITNKYETLLEDGTFTVTYTVTNIGDGNAGASNTTIYIDSANVLEDHVPALAAGASYTNTVGHFNCPCDETLNVTVCADNGNVVDESNETNNCMENELTCQPCRLPDLVITDIWCKEVRTNTYEIYYNITNIGDADTLSGIVSNLTVNGSATRKKSRVKPLAAEVTSTGKFTYRSKTLPPYTIKVCADCGKKSITESNETNNCMEKTVTCTWP